MVESLLHRPFILFIGKYDRFLGPEVVKISEKIWDRNEITQYLNDSLNIKNKYIVLEFKDCYVQIIKFFIQNPTLKKGKQKYAIGIIRDKKLPKLPLDNLKKIEFYFKEIGSENILSENQEKFDFFIEKILKNYILRKRISFPLNHSHIKCGLN